MGTTLFSRFAQPLLQGGLLRLGVRRRFPSLFLPSIALSALITGGTILFSTSDEGGKGPNRIGQWLSGLAYALPSSLLGTGFLCHLGPGMTFLHDFFLIEPAQAAVTTCVGKGLESCEPETQEMGLWERYEGQLVQGILFMGFGRFLGRGIDLGHTFLRPKEAKRLILDYHEGRNSPSEEELDNALGIPSLQQESTDQLAAVEQRHPGERLELGQANYRLIRGLVTELRLEPQDVIFDLGSGHGRVALYMGITTRARVVGIEIVPERVALAERARARLNLKNVRFVEGSVLDHDFSDGTVFYLFNPFSERSLGEISGRLQAIAQTRTIRVVSYGPCNDYLYRQSWLRSTTAVKTPEVIHSQVMIFKSIPPPPPPRPNPFPRGEIPGLAYKVRDPTTKIEIRKAAAVSLVTASRDHPDLVPEIRRTLLKQAGIETETTVRTHLLEQIQNLEVGHPRDLFPFFRIAVEKVEGRAWPYTIARRAYQIYDRSLLPRTPRLKFATFRQKVSGPRANPHIVQFLEEHGIRPRPLDRPDEKTLRTAYAQAEAEYCLSKPTEDPIPLSRLTPRAYKDYYGEPADRGSAHYEKFARLARHRVSSLGPRVQKERRVHLNPEEALRYCLRAKEDLVRQSGGKQPSLRAIGRAGHALYSADYPETETPSKKHFTDFAIASKARLHGPA